MDLKTKALELETTVRIGKNGLTDGQIAEIDNQLKTRKLVKVKLLRAFVEEHDKKEAMKEIASRTKSKLIQFIGFVGVFHRR